MILELKNISKIYSGTISKQVLKDINFKLDEGEFVSIMGPSGSGKTSLLNIIGTLDRASEGSIIFDNRLATNLSKNELATFRRKDLGIIFQSFNLLKTLTVQENIMLPLTLDKVSVEKMREQTKALLDEFHLTELANKSIHEISGGEAQKVAIARALIHRPRLILADEPTGNLDSTSSKEVMELLTYINMKKHVSILMVTHDPLAASYTHRVNFIRDGHLVSELYNKNNQEQFYQSILNELADFGGEDHELL